MVHPPLRTSARASRGIGLRLLLGRDHTIVPVQSSTSYPGVKQDGREPDFVWQLPDPLMALARAAVTTSRLEVGTGFCLVPERNPILTAKQIATLDDACGGGSCPHRHRVEPEDLTILGGDFDHRWTQAKEFVAAMKVLWQDEVQSITVVM